MRRIWELYGSYPAAIWELSESQQGYLGSQGALRHLGSYLNKTKRRQNTHVPLTCKVNDAFLRVGITKYSNSKKIAYGRQRGQAATQTIAASLATP